MTTPEVLDAAPFSIGSVVGGKYRVLEQLGVGGMGVVMLARHDVLGQDVALKLLLPSVAPDADAVQRFVREAQAAARLKSDHVVRVFDVGVHESGVPYLVMERLEGRDLADELAARGPLPVSDAVDLVVAALAGIGEAHSIGLVHRDLKPSNLFLATRPDGPPRLKVLDFGISKITNNQELESAVLTSSKSMLGSPGYMSPEQIRSSRAVDARTDVWAMGVVLYELLTGRAAYDGETLGDVFAKIREEELPALRGIRPEVPPGLEAVVARCLRRTRDERYADARELRTALLPYGSREASGGASMAVAVSSVAVDARAPTIASTRSPLRGRADAGTRTAAAWATNSQLGRGSRKVAVAAIAFVALVGAAGAFWWQSSNDRSGDSRVSAEAPPPPSPSPSPSLVAAPAGSTDPGPSPAPVESAVSPPPPARAASAPRPPIGSGKLGRPTATPPPLVTPTASARKKDTLGI